MESGTQDGELHLNEIHHLYLQSDRDFFERCYLCHVGEKERGRRHSRPTRRDLHETSVCELQVFLDGTTVYLKVIP